VRGLLPHADESFLRHVFGFAAWPQQAPGERQQPRQFARDHLARRTGLAAAHASQQFRVGIILAQWSPSPARVLSSGCLVQTRRLASWT
jgi:hypothetical protein